MALGGYKEPQQLMALAYLLSLGGELDILINLDGFNDIALPLNENIPKHVNPFYPRSWDLRINAFSDLETQHLIGKISFIKDLRQKWAKVISKKKNLHSVSLNFVWRIGDRLMSDFLSKFQLELQKYKPNALSYSVTGPSMTDSNDDELYNDLVSFWGRSSLLINDLCRTNKIKYFHFLQPNQYFLNSKPIGPQERKVAILDSSPFNQIVKKGYPLLKKEGENLKIEGVQFFDLTYAFFDIKEPLYVDNCCHFFNGNDLLAKLIAKNLLENFPKEGALPQSEK